MLARHAETHLMTATTTTTPTNKPLGAWKISGVDLEKYHAIFRIQPFEEGSSWAALARGGCSPGAALVEDSRWRSSSSSSSSITGRTVPTPCQPCQPVRESLCSRLCTPPYTHSLRQKARPLISVRCFRATKSNLFWNPRNSRHVSLKLLESLRRWEICCADASCWALAICRRLCGCCRRLGRSLRAGRPHSVLQDSVKTT